MEPSVDFGKILQMGKVSAITAGKGAAKNRNNTHIKGNKVANGAVNLETSRL